MGNIKLGNWLKYNKMKKIKIEFKADKKRKSLDL